MHFIVGVIDTHFVHVISFSLLSILSTRNFFTQIKDGMIILILL